LLCFVCLYPSGAVEVAAAVLLQVAGTVLQH